MVKPKNIKVIEQLLESDDELPSSYNDDPVQPAYTNDNRFNTIEFKWIYNSQMQSFLKNGYSKNSHKSIDKNIEYKNDMKSEMLEKQYITKGFLTRQDLLCLKSIVGTMSDGMVLWFADFLVHKDLQAPHTEKFKGCLVESFPIKQDSNDYKNKDISNIYENKKYKIVVKI